MSGKGMVTRKAGLKGAPDVPVVDGASKNVCNVLVETVVESGSEPSKVAVGTVELASPRNKEKGKAKIDISPVTPDPAAMKKALEDNFYLLNMTDGTFLSYKTAAEADKMKDLMTRVSPCLIECLSVLPCDSDESVRKFIETCQAMNKSKGGVEVLKEGQAVETPQNDMYLGMKNGTVAYAASYIRKDPVSQIANPYSQLKKKLSIDSVGTANLNESSKRKLDFQPLPVLKGKDGSPSKKAATQGSQKLDAFRNAMRASAVGLDVLRWNFPHCTSSVFAWRMMENNNDYWSHKPNIWEKVSLTELGNPIFDKEEHLSVFEMLNAAQSANMRCTPYGPDNKAVITLKRGGTLDRNILYGTLPSAKTDEEVVEQVTKFISFTKDPRVREVYKMAIDDAMKAVSIKNDVSLNGPYWQKMAAAANNVTFRQMDHLNEVFMDSTIEDLIGHIYGLGPQTMSMWTPSIREVAFGRSYGNPDVKEEPEENV
jgi:hypothetical protein